VSTAVLIVNYHAYRDLDLALASLEAHLSDGDEIVIVDYESDARALDYVLGRHPQARALRRSDNLGFSAGINLAARSTTAPYCLWLNPDALLEGPVVRVLEDWLNTHPRAGVAGPRVLNTDGTVQPSARHFPGPTTVFGGRSTWLTQHFPNNWMSRRNLIGRDASAPVDVDWLAGACLMTRREVFDRAGGLDESFFMYWEDADYCHRVAGLGFTSTYVPTVAVRHSGGASSSIDLPRAIRAFHASAFHLYWKHYGPIGRLAAPLVWAGLRLRGELRVWQAEREQRLKGERPSASRAAAIRPDESSRR